MGETYPYEQLDGRRFQLLAQSLFTAEHREVQCLSLSGPDGGRDAVGMSRHPEDRSLKDTLIFQVKFREQNPLGTPTTEDLYRWVIANLKAELPKVRKLARRGAELFTFVTNVAATGHLDGGLRDRVQDWLSKNLPLPAAIWWREDLDARLSRHSDLIFKFSLFRGVESVRAYFQSLLPGGAVPSVLSGVSLQPSHPGVATMILYLRKQYEEEESIRFKQVDIDPIPVLKHFVDTPILMQRRGLNVNYFHDLLESVDPTTQASDEYFDEEEILVKAARLFLNEKFVDGFRKIVLEGAPGQGKTTLVQYIGQIHRARILHRVESLADVPTELTVAPLRLPIRIELRHFGSWLQGESPWPSAAGGTSGRPAYPSIPSFISAHAAYSTGGLELTTNDVIAILAKTPSLLMLDGLDEVPDAGVRSRIVEMAEEFIKDLSAFDADVQVIVTSRPSASSKAAVFSRQGFKYLELADLTEEEIWEYANDWIVRKKIGEQEAATFIGVLGDCLQKQHVADLARNPMQLAILLWLIHVRDWSLPDKRTALYDQYMATFLDREATKDPVVRQHRTILLELHGYIAWVLHSRSEQEMTSGSGDISRDELKRLMQEYLESQEEDRAAEVIDGLFRGMQRIFALTERIQGRFEFEIQSMREFFAGTYLYKTAPHYSNAVEVSGSRPDRLEALIRNPYWLNVVRFFCGWYDKGELADLTRRLVDLCEMPDYRLLSHPRELISSLLGDHVTHASKRDTRQLAEQLTDPLSLRAVGRILTREVVSSSIAPNAFTLPAMANEAMKLYPSVRTDEIVYELAALIRSHVSAADRFSWWSEARPNSAGEDFSAWLRSGSIVHAFNGAQVAEVADSLNLSSGIEESWIRCVESGRLDVALSNSYWFENFLSCVAAGNTVLSYPNSPEGRFIHEIWQLLDLGLSYRYVRRPPESIQDVPQRNSAFRAELTELLKLFAWFGEEAPDFAKILSLVQQMSEVLGRTCWASWKIVSLLAPPLSSVPKGFRSGIAQTALRCWDRRDDLGFWADFIDDDETELMFRVAGFTSWAPAAAFHAQQEKLAAHWEVLQPWQMSLIQTSIQMQHSSDVRDFRSRRFTNTEFRDLPVALPGCMLPTLEGRLNRKYASPVMVNACTPCLKHISVDSAYRITQLINILGRGRAGQFDADLSRIQAMFPQARSGIVAPMERSVMALHSPKGVPARFVRKILENPFEFPFVLVDAAQQIANGEMVHKLPSLAKISKQDSWFG